MSPRSAAISPGRGCSRPIHGFSLRQQAWAGIPHALDDTGATVARLVAELRSMIDDAAAPLEARHAVEIAELEERIERYGERGSRQA